MKILGSQGRASRIKLFSCRTGQAPLKHQNPRGGLHPSQSASGSAAALPRADYLARTKAAHDATTTRSRLSCTNLAHGFAASSEQDKDALKRLQWPNLAIVTSYNDMLSAHQPFERFPGLIRAAAREAGATAQVAGGTPAMCDGVTQGQTGMELSLFSRDVIAMSTAIALSHNMFDATLCLGVCDKIVPGLLIGALTFGHLPTIFVPGGPMPSGVANQEKARIRKLYAEGQGDARGVARVRVRQLSLRRHVHFLRHSQQQSDADGDHGAASAGQCVYSAEYSFAGCAHHFCYQARGPHHCPRR